MQNFNYNILDVMVQVYLKQKKIGQEPHRGPKAQNGINRHFNKKNRFSLHSFSIFFLFFKDKLLS